MMATAMPDRQIELIGRLHGAFERQGLAYWIFGGWAVDFHAGGLTRPHVDIDMAVWKADLNRIEGVLGQEGWSRTPQPGEDGYTEYQNGSARLDLAFLALDEDDTIYTPLSEGRGSWPAHSFGQDIRELNGTVARVVSLASLIADKSEYRDDPITRKKDAADCAVLLRCQRVGPTSP
jgi:hypothetical protein